MALKLASTVGMALALTAEAWGRPAVGGAACQGPFPVKGAGPTYIAGNGGSVAGNTLTLQHDGELSVMSKCSSVMSPHDFYGFKLLGKTMSFDVDLSKAGCGCNVAFYLTTAPAVDKLGNPALGTCDNSPYYCDANQVCGFWCPDIDIIEGNSRAVQSKQQTCDGPSEKGYYSRCDTVGQAKNTRFLSGDLYGPGSKHKIDTTRPFSVAATFSGSTRGTGAKATGTVTSMKTVLRQDGRSVVLQNTNSTYLNSLWWPLSTGMSIRISYWGETMQWLDGCDASETCAKGDVTISNVQFRDAEELVFA